MEALQPGAAPIDGRSLADILYFISQYAGQVNFHDYKKDDIDGEYVELSDWRSFFRNSTPFLLARVSKTDLERIETTFLELSSAVNDQPIAENLDLLLSFVYRELIESVSELYRTVDEAGISFDTDLSLIIKSSLQEPLMQYIALFNASARHLCTRKQSFSAYTAYPWQLSVQDTFGINACIKKQNTSKQGAIAEVNRLLKPVFYQMFSGLKQIAAAAPGYIQESLLPQETALQKLHQPHLGLLFAFLELFRHFQGDLNQLGQKHLDFFFSKVLNIKAKEAIPDKAHIVFELANHLEQYALNGGIQLKDGKDANNQDILFALDDEIVLDKAAVADVRTLYLNSEKITVDAVEQSFVEGLYIAPVANSADGKGKAFKEKDSKNWPTLGGKYSKCILPGQDDPEEHPKARIGFVMASPALLLQEGTREVIFTIECNPPIDKAGVDCLKKLADPLSSGFMWGKYYWLTENVVEALQRNEKVSQQTVDALNQLLARQNPYPVGFQQSQLYELLYDEDCNSDKKQQAIEIDAMDPLLEAFSETIHKCFLQKKDLDNALLSNDVTSDIYPVLQKLGHVFDDDDVVVGTLDGKNPIRYVNFNALQVSPDFEDDVNALLKGGSIFRVAFSGAEKWIEPECVMTTLLCNDDGQLIGFKIFVGLPPELPAVTFYDKDALKEDLHLDHRFPAVKIELRDDINIQMDIDKNSKPNDQADPCTLYLNVIDSTCCLVQNEAREKISVSLYDILREIKVASAKIDVRVCGVRNLVVQNDENLQDVNSPILPFGTRPHVGNLTQLKTPTTPGLDPTVPLGSNFYIGSKEVFCKNWQSYWININWKGKPGDLKDHYKFYDFATYEDKSGVIENNSFRFLTSMLYEGAWIQDKDHIRTIDVNANIATNDLFELFPENPPNQTCNNFCLNKKEGASTYCHEIKRDYFLDKLSYVPKNLSLDELTSYNINSRKGFARLTLAGVSFQHDRYTYVLTRHMVALSKAIDTVSFGSALGKLSEVIAVKDQLIQLKGDIIDKCNDIEDLLNDFVLPEFDDIRESVNELKNNLDYIADNFVDGDLIDTALAIIVAIQPTANALVANLGTWPKVAFPNNDGPYAAHIVTLNQWLGDLKIMITGPSGLESLLVDLETKIQGIESSLTANAALQSGLPKEPYTPTIKELSIDYTAIAEMDDIDFVHLYPYQNTSKVEDITQTPCLLPTFRDEGTLFIGLNKLQPGGSLNLLFQLAEATADTEQDRADVRWYYLTGNHWLPLRKGFEVIADNTDGLTVSGIVQIIVPDDISDRHNTILPEGLFWIRVSAAENVRAVSETIGIHTQAARATALLPKTADKKRLAQALPAGSIAKLDAADFSIKKVEQPYASFGGKTPEADGHLYTRVSEHLRHKGRGQMLFDYEHLVMEAFPQIYKVKCISHTMGLSAHTYVRDLEIAPGFVVIAVIPDLTKLIPGNMMEPRAPVSLLEQIADYLRQRVSPFARLKVLNPRFEKVDVNISVRLRRGKPKDYYAKQLKTDLLQFLAPWYLGDSEKIAFGQNLLFSDVVKFTESLDYVDFIAELELIGPCDQTGSIIRPLTARSILTGGTVCVKIDDENCPTVTNKTKPEDSANPRALAGKSDWDCDTTDTFFSKPRIADSDDCMTP